MAGAAVSRTSRPPSGPLLLGLAVGVAQLFKYNGWLAGAIVVLAAVVWLARHPREWRSRRTAATWGWGLVAALVAAAVYWPWFAFVESHGGYGALLAHQRGYLGGFASWPGHLMAQLAQSRALSGGPVWLVASGLAAAFAMTVISELPATASGRSSPRILLPMLSLSALCLLPNLAWWVPLAWLPVLRASESNGRPGSRDLPLRGLADALGADAVLPSLCAALAAGRGLRLVVHRRSVLPASARDSTPRPEAPMATRGRRSVPLDAGGILLAASAIAVEASVISRHSERADCRACSRRATRCERPAPRSRHDLPKDVKYLRVLARPPVTFYLGQSAGVSLDRQPSLSSLFEAGRSRRPGRCSTWRSSGRNEALEAELERSSSRLGAGPCDSHDLELARACSISIRPPQPAANVDAEVELRLFRPKRAGDRQ